MCVFEFDHAVVREPGGSVAQGLRSDPRTVVDAEAVRHEHAGYVAALRAAGLEVEVLPPLEAYPDSVFVEDTALVFPEGAILLRPGAPSRRGEAAHMRKTLERHFGELLALEGDERADGGDVLVTPACVFVGISQRTDLAGARALAAHLGRLDRKAQIVATPQSILHLKSAVSLLDGDTVLATCAMAESGIFASLRILVVPESEERAANALRVNDLVLVDASCPRTADCIAHEGFAVRTLLVPEIAKLDAGLSCLSLRWKKGRTR